ncbi:hypothetical protein PMZ80_002638 [Knufia obscura]|uniref:Uncharacterized protein n=1 Tax=Knufia obscura TaxID=1635080 RepID=A0ABR0RXX8_9EURO|nr:hypothetical protein PMZ80_002638 [Knufia obscura]
MDRYMDDNTSSIDQDFQALSIGSALNTNRASVLQQIGDTTFPLELSELIHKSFDRNTDNSHARASYFQGSLLRDIVPAAIEPLVAIVFLPGADRMAVAALEQKYMTKEEPNQKSPSWRVLTAGTLLCDIQVNDDLYLTQSDCTPDVAARARQRMMRDSATASSSTAMVLRRGDDRVLTIDSNNVKIVAELSPGAADVEATLIEVNKISLLNLLTNFRQVLSTDARDYNELLEVMIEDARRLAIRSPVLFRMSTRQRIIQSRNTRYGVDHGTMFETIATSAAIKNIVLKSDACYHALSDPGAHNDSQAVIRPRVLQMLTLFISLLNDMDLRSIATFLEKTYKIKSDRSSIEMLVMKVLPLASINSSIFVREMFGTVEQTQYSRLPDSEASVWTSFIERILARGYILPGFTEQMGQPRKSWLLQFPPEDGFKDTFVFNNLQYEGESNCTFNQIPSIELGTNDQSQEVTIVLTNGRRYLIDNTDNRKIVGMVFGDYSLTEADGNRRTFDLTISEEAINQELSHAIQQINKILRIINGVLASTKLKGKIVKLIANGLETLNFPRPVNSVITYEDVRSCGRLTFHQARLGDQILAVAYKVEGKKVHRRDLIRNLAADLRSVRSTVLCVEHELDRYRGHRVSDDVRHTMASVRDMIPEVNQFMGLAEQKKQRLEKMLVDVNDEPIKQTIYPASVGERSIATYWSPYRASLHDKTLRTECCRDQVRKVVWANEEIAEIWLMSESIKFFVSPLRKLLVEEQESEIKVGDKVLLLGQYIVIVDVDHLDNEGAREGPLQAELPSPSPYPIPRSGTDAPGMNVPNRSTHLHANIGHSRGRQECQSVTAEVFANWMKIVGVEKRLMDRRRVNRAGDKRMVVSSFA